MDELKARLMTLRGPEVFIIDTRTGLRYSYDELYEETYLLAKGLSECGVSEIAVCMDNSIELIELYFAAMMANIIIIPIDPEKSDMEKERILMIHSKAKYITNIDEVLISENDETKFLWEDIVEKIDYEKIFLITYTSGSTGVPKGVKNSLKNLLMASEMFYKTMGYSEQTRLAHVMPMTYMAGILNSIFLPYYAGGKIILFPRFNMNSVVNFWKRAVEFEVNTFWLSPTMLRIINIIDKEAKYKEYLQKCNATFSVGTAPLDSELRKQFESKYGIRLYQSYGLSETLFLTTEVTSIPVSDNSSGVLLPQVELRISSEGEGLVKVPWIFLGYENNETDKLDEEGYYHTGDLVEVVDGSVFIRGRVKDLVLKGGYNINPNDIEKFICEKYTVKELIISGFVKKGEELIGGLYVSDEELNIAILNHEIELGLGRHYKIDRLLKVTEIPKNINGKTDGNRVRDMLCF